MKGYRIKTAWKKVTALLFAAVFFLLCGCRDAGYVVHTESPDLSAEQAAWHFGFGREQIIPDADSTEPLYIAGYNTAVEIEDVLDYCEARAVWIDNGGAGVLLIGIDCIALDSGVIGKIREGLSDVENCAAVHVYATHTHAGADTLGLWGPTAVDGKNDAYMQNLIDAAISAGRQAAAEITPGRLYYGYAETDAQEMLRDSRYPTVCDANLYQLRFEAENGEPGLRMLFYTAHAEALRSVNCKLSRDYPGLLCDGVTEATGDNTIYMPGAVGGLLMTQEFVPTALQSLAEQNLRITGDKLVAYAMSVQPEDERELLPEFSMSTATFTVPLDNTGFLLFRFLGILSNQAVKGGGDTGYSVQSELSVLQLGGVTLVLVPGEIFPELVYGVEYGDAGTAGENPEPLCAIAEEFGAEDLLVIGLANDELGYIVPPSDFLLNEELPYLEKTMDGKGENHYEETNSVGPECADAVAAAFRAAMEALR